MKIEVTTKDNKLVELKEIKNIEVCPSDNSPRYEYYNLKNCRTDDISLNNLLRQKTYDIEEWSRIKINIENQKDKYKENGYRDARILSDSLVKNNDNTISLIIDVEEGEQYTFGKIWTLCTISVDGRSSR